MVEARSRWIERSIPEIGEWLESVESEVLCESVVFCRKTTLMDVLAGRKTGGYIEGDIRISGYPKNQRTFARISGYCEQNDIHSPQITVRESLIYSAWLRLAADIDGESKMVSGEFLFISICNDPQCVLTETSVFSSVHVTQFEKFVPSFLMTKGLNVCKCWFGCRLLWRRCWSWWS